MARRRDDTVLLKAAALGAIAGMRSMAAPALLSRELSDGLVGSLGRGGGLNRILSSRATARVLAFAAGGEMLADKTPFVGDRTSPLPLLGRAIIGSMTAAVYAARRREPVVLPALVGGAAAVAVTYAAFHLRRLAAEQLRVPDRVLGAIEDAIVVGGSRQIAERL